MSDGTHTWKKGRLGDHAYVRARIGWRGLSASEYTSDGPYLIAGKHIVGDRVDWDRCDHLNRHRYDESSEIALETGDVILSKDGTLGRTARLDSLPGEATINGTMMLVRCRDELDYRFVNHYLNGHAFRQFIADKVSGSSIPHIFQRDMVTLELPIPSLSEQRRIAEILDTVDDSIRSTEQVIAKLEQMKRGLIHDLLTRGVDDSGEIRDPRRHPERFVDSILGKVPRGWSVGPLGEAVRLQRGFDITVAEQRPGDVPVVSSSGITSHHDTAMVGGPGVVIGRKGKLGNAYYMHSDFWPHDTTLWVTDFKGSLPIFVTLLLASMHLERLDAATSVPTLNRNVVHPLPVAVPDRAEQERIVARMSIFDMAAEAERSNLAKLQLSKNGLVDDLLTGRVRVGADSEDGT